MYHRGRRLAVRPLYGQTGETVGGPSCAREARERANAPTNRLNNYFNSIANATSVASANASINEALTMFSSGDAPVLIVISEEGGKKDYDEPTTIKKYLEYLKDTKNNMNKIANLQFDSAGKISEVELKKN